MAELELNLSTRPFPAYRLMNVGLVSVLVILIVLTVSQAWGFLHYSSLADSIRRDEQTARVESETSAQQLAVLAAKLDRPESAAKLNDIGFLNSLIARRELSWTDLFANLENMVPETVRLVSLKPEIPAEGPVLLMIDARGRSLNDIAQFISLLEQAPMFEEVKIFSEEKVNPEGGADLNVTLSARYYPEKQAR
jgi:hypothetical protein